MEKRPRLLIIDDDPRIPPLVKTSLKDIFIFETASNGETGWKKTVDYNPDIILCDYEMPVLNGIELCRRIKADAVYRHIPIVMLTALDDVDSIVSGLEAGADDYLCKPFNATELRVRLLTQLRRRAQDLEADPLTHLPSGDRIRIELQKYIDEGKPFTAIYLDLNHFKAFADRYGFIRASDVIRHTARLLFNDTRSIAGKKAFIGHIAGDDFLIITDIETADPVCRKIIESFDSSVIRFYDSEDAENGYVMAHSRDTGKLREYPLLSISLCVVHSDAEPVNSAYDIARIALRLKLICKKQGKSAIARNTDSIY